MPAVNSCAIIEALMNEVFPSLMSKQLLPKEA